MARKRMRGLAYTKVREELAARSTIDSPIADAETGDTVCHLDDNKLAATAHFARLALPCWDSASVHSLRQRSASSVCKSGSQTYVSKASD